VRTAVALGLALLSLPLGSADASAAPDDTSWWSNVAIRNAFDGASREQQPAIGSYVNGSDRDKGFWLVDLGARFAGWDWTPGGVDLVVYPTVEWHRNQGERLVTGSLDTHTLGGGVTAELYAGNADRSAIVPYVVIRGNLFRDFIQDKTETSVSAMVTTYSARSAGYYPGGLTLDAHGHWILRYHPYAGVERFQNLALGLGGITGPGVSATFATARLYFEWYPFNLATRPGLIRFQVIGDATYRRALFGAADLPSNMLSSSVSANYYFDEGRRFAVGPSFEAGRTPRTNFQALRRVVVALKLRL